MVPSASVMVPTLPVTPLTVGVADVVVTAGQTVAHAPVHVLFPELAVSLVNRYTVCPMPSTTTLPSDVFPVAKSSPVATGADFAEPDDDEPGADEPAEAVDEQPARAIADIANPAIVSTKRFFMSNAFLLIAKSDGADIRSHF
jgi:hypothetical protein